MNQNELQENWQKKKLKRNSIISPQKDEIDKTETYSKENAEIRLSKREYCTEGGRVFSIKKYYKCVTLEKATTYWQEGALSLQNKFY